ncbi:hypothetical protein MRB53_037072 [Persea americana]|nr:hypothetical protein MRB53_037072 [Persea americana]
MAPIALTSLESAQDKPSTQTNGHSNGTTLKATAPSFHPTGTPDPTRYHASSSKESMRSEANYAAHNYHPLPIVFARAAGCSVWDPEGKQYLDFVRRSPECPFNCLCNIAISIRCSEPRPLPPELVKALVEQAQRLTLSSRAFYNDVFPRFARVCHQGLRLRHAAANVHGRRGGRDGGEDCKEVGLQGQGHSAEQGVGV